MSNPFRQFIDNLNASLAEQKRQQAIKAAEHRERIKPYLRGYDVFPEGDGSHYVTGLAVGAIVKIIIGWLFVFGYIFFFITDRKRIEELLPFALILGFIAIVLFFYALSQLFLLVRIVLGKYDIYGGMVTDRRVEEHTTYDSENGSSTSYNYFISLNGIECEVSHGQYSKAKEETYCRFVVIRKKYIKNDSFYLYPCDASEQDRRIAQHYPGTEARLYRSDGIGVPAVLLSIFSIIGAVMLFTVAKVKSGRPLETTPGMIAVGLIAFAFAVILISDIRRRINEHRKIEERKKHE